MSLKFSEISKYVVNEHGILQGNISTHVHTTSISNEEENHKVSSIVSPTLSCSNNYLKTQDSDSSICEGNESDNDYIPSTDDSFSEDEQNEASIDKQVNLQRKAVTPLVTYSETDTGTYSDNEQTMKTKKRKKNVKLWKKSIRKRKCLSGKEYISAYIL